MSNELIESMGLTKAVKRLWCGLTHGGGHIERDELGRINWRCAKCGMWGDSPVPLRDEAIAVRQALKEMEP